MQVGTMNFLGVALLISLPQKFSSHAGGRPLFIMKENAQIQAIYCYKGELRHLKAITDVLLLFLRCKRQLLCCKIVASELVIKIFVHVIDET